MVLTHQQGGEAETGVYVLMFQTGILLQYLLFAVAGHEIIQNGLRGDPFSAYRRFAIANGRVDGDASVQEGERR